MGASDPSVLETKAREFKWTEKRKSGSTSIDVSIIAREVFEGWDISEMILGEDMKWYQPSLRDYRRLCDYVDTLKAASSFCEY